VGGITERTFPLFLVSINQGEHLMFTSLKRPVIAVTAIIAVSAPSVASARFFEYGGTSPVPPAHLVLANPGPNPDEQIPWDRTQSPWIQANHQRPGKQSRHRQLTAQQVNVATGASGNNRGRGLPERARSLPQWFSDSVAAFVHCLQHRQPSACERIDGGASVSHPR
jgi:hypothetical protein